MIQSHNRDEETYIETYKTTVACVHCGLRASVSTAATTSTLQLSLIDRDGMVQAIWREHLRQLRGWVVTDGVRDMCPDCHKKFSDIIKKGDWAEAARFLTAYWSLN